MNASEQRALSVLGAAGLDPDLKLQRAPASSEVWVGDQIVVRVHVGREDDGLAREAALAAVIPPGVRHPEVIANGRDGDAEWLVARRVTGIPLAHAWPDMEIDDRRRATMQLAVALRALHRTQAENLPHDEDVRPPHVLPLDRALDQAEQVRALLDPGLYADAVAFMSERWEAFDDEDRGLVHGDPHLENVLWHEGQVTALLDFEWARLSWIHTDLEILLHVAADPARFISAPHNAAARPYDYRMVPAWLADAYPEWFAHPRLADRLVILCINRMFGLLHDDPRADVAKMVRELLDGKSHLHRLLA